TVWLKDTDMIAKSDSVSTPDNYSSQKIFPDEDNPVIVKAVILHKMASTPRDKVYLVDRNRVYIEMDNQAWKWTDLPLGLKQVKFGNTEEERETLYLLSKMKIEANNWNDVLAWDINVQAKFIGGQPALNATYTQNLGVYHLHAIFVDLSKIEEIQPTDQVAAVTAMFNDLK
ncbi:1258_t:CDS:2, partial [Paraglomus occultum]